MHQNESASIECRRCRTDPYLGPQVRAVKTEVKMAGPRVGTPGYVGIRPETVRQPARLQAGSSLSSAIRDEVLDLVVCQGGQLPERTAVGKHPSSFYERPQDGTDSLSLRPVQDPEYGRSERAAPSGWGNDGRTRRLLPPRRVSKQMEPRHPFGVQHRTEVAQLARRDPVVRGETLPAIVMSPEAGEPQSIPS